MRTRNVCKGGVDAVIDFASSVRTVGRSLKVLKEGGAIVVGGNSKCDVPLRLHTLATRNQTVFGVHRGSRDQLVELVDLVANKKILPPVYTVFPVEEADAVFRQLSQSKIDGRAVLRVFSDAGGSSNGSLVVSPSADSIPPFSPGPDELMSSASPDAMSPREDPKGFFLP